MAARLVGAAAEQGDSSLGGAASYLRHRRLRLRPLQTGEIARDRPTPHAVPSTPSGIARRRRSRISGPRSSTIGVHTVPGAIALTRIAFGASWFATLTTKPRMPALAAAYAVPQAPRTAATDDTHVTAPPPRRSRAGTAAWVASSIDLRSTAITRSHSSSVVSISVWRDSMPTLLCSTSSPPQRPTASATIAVRLVGDVGGEGERLAFLRADEPDRLLRAILLRVHAEHARALARHEDRGGLAVAHARTARARARHDRDLAGESFAHCGRVTARSSLRCSRVFHGGR